MQLKQSVFTRSAMVLLLAAALGAPVRAQGDVVPPRGEMPFSVGETLTYDGKINRILRGISVAELSLTVTELGNEGMIRIKADAKSKGTLLSLFRYSFFYQYISDIDGTRFRIDKTDRRTTEKERRRDGEAIFDYTERRVTYIETDPSEPMRPPRKIASGITEVSHDVVSGIYALRLTPLAVGKTLHFTVSDSGLVYDVPVRVTAREEQKTIFGKVQCFRLEPAVFGPGRMIESKGSMIIWITDDARRIPVRSQLKTEYGKIEIRLKTASNLK